MNHDFLTTCERILSAAANGIYQGVILAALAGLTLRLFNRTNASTRHAVWLGTLLLVTAMIPAHLLIGWLHQPESALASVHSKEQAVAAAPAQLQPDEIPASLAAQSSDPALNALEPADTTFKTLPALTADPQVTENPSASSYAKLPSAVNAEIPSPMVQNPPSRKFYARLNLPNSISLLLVFSWVLIAGFRGVKLALGFADVIRAKRASRAAGPGLQALFERTRQSLGARRRIRLRISDTQSAAMLLGYIRPVVLLPAEMEEDANCSEVRDVLRHELAHVARWDDWANLVQQLIQCALFFHPAVLWISPRLTLEREIACDDHVLDASVRPRAYALTLATMAGRMNQRRQLLAPGVSNNNSQLKQRINMILNTQRNCSPALARSRVGFATLLTASLALLVINAGPRLVLAQTPTAPDQPAVRPDVNAVRISANSSTSPAALPPDFESDDSDPRTKANQNINNFAPAAPRAGISSGYAPQPQVVSDYALQPMPRDGKPATVASAEQPSPAQTPAPPRLPKRSMSVEERLDRIERMLEKLQARSGAVYRSDAAANLPLTQPASPFSHSFSYSYPAPGANPAELEAETKRAIEAGRRAAADAARNFERFKSQDLERLQKDLNELGNKGMFNQLEALRSARESMRREMENMDRQIKQLEKNAEFQKKQAENLKNELDDDAAPRKR